MQKTNSSSSFGLYELCAIYEFDFLVGPERWSIRVELFKSIKKAGIYRSNICKYESYVMKPSFKNDGGWVADERLMVDCSMYIEKKHLDILYFKAKSNRDALLKVANSFNIGGKYPLLEII